MTTTDDATGAELVEPILRWYDAHARDLPWRRPEASAWSVLVRWTSGGGVSAV